MGFEVGQPGGLGPLGYLGGDDVEARKGFIQKNAKDVRFLDI